VATENRSVQETTFQAAAYLLALFCSADVFDHCIRWEEVWVVHGMDGFIFIMTPRMMNAEALYFQIPIPRQVGVGSLLPNSIPRQVGVDT
jgi:hypothetical protein